MRTMRTETRHGSILPHGFARSGNDIRVAAAPSAFVRPGPCPAAKPSPGDHHVTLTATPAARVRARQRWRALADRLQSVSPQALARGGIAVAVTVLVVSLTAGTWPALAPFVVGAVIAYAVLPIANRLDRFMPRVLAAILAELVAVAILVGVAVLVVPPLLDAA